jgi:ABC-type transport system substrate-binding protein
MHSRYFKFCTLLYTIVFLTINACSKNEPVEFDRHKFGGVYRTTISSRPISLDPTRVDSLVEMQIMDAIYSTLVRIDSNGDVVPHLAIKWNIRGNGKVYEFFLRDNVFFHNGKAMTVDDVIFSLTRILHKDSLYKDSLRFLQGYDDYIDNKTNQIRGIYKTEHSIVFLLETPFSPLLKMLTSINFAILPKDNVINNNGFFQSSVGSGPFKINKRKTNEKVIVLDAYDQYFRSRPYLDSVEFLVEPDPKKSIALFRKGKIENPQIEYSWESSNLKSKQNIFISEMRTWLIGFNTSLKPFNNPNIRKAIRDAINIEEIQKNLEDYYPNLQSTNSYIPKGMIGYDPNIVTPTFSIEKAKQTIENERVDLNRIAPIHFKIKMARPAAALIVKEIETAFKRLGIKLILDNNWEKPSATNFLRDSHMFYLSVAPNFPDPYFLLNYYYSRSDAERSYNIGNYKNKEYNELLDRLAIEDSYENRLRLIKKLNNLLIDDAVVIPIFCGSASSGVFRNYVKGFEFPHVNRPFPLMETIWFDKSKTI